MQFSELSVLLPCHSLEDFPTYHEGREADELLTAWCALWHPALLASAGALPTWHRVDLPPESLSGRLIAIPPFCVDRLPAGFTSRIASQGGLAVRESTRDAAVAAALAGLDGGSRGIDERLAADFLALGFCRLQIELLTRAMRYSVNIDETHFQNETIAAAKAAAEHDEETARAHLVQCFETLCEARQRFYPVDFHFIDLTLVAETTLGEALDRELSRDTPINLAATTRLWQCVAKARPASWAALLAAIDRATACVLGGEEIERALPLVPLETAGESLARGVRQYEALLGRRPQVFARRRAGLWPALPQILAKLGYQGVLHFTLDDGRFPTDRQCKARWEGIDSSTIDMLARLPCDAAKAETFLGLSRRMADSMDNDHVATLMFAHWPGAASPWYDDLRRIAALSPVLGKFMLLDDYFAHTDMPGRLSKFEADEYRTPYLKQTIERRQSDACSAFVREHAAQAVRAAVQAIETLGDLVLGRPRESEANRNELTAAIERLAQALPHGTGSASPRYLVVNPLSFARSIGVELPSGLTAPGVAPPVVASGASGEKQFAVVEVPAMGFAWIEPGGPAAATGAKPIARDNVLANEFFEVTVSRTTGGIASIYDFNHRGNQLSQQLAFRMPGAPPEPGSVWRDPDEDAAYTTMQAESVEVAASCAAFGEITSRGQLVDASGRRLARFRQRTQAWAANRVVRIEIELEDVDDPRADPWNSYYAARFAWPDDNAELWRGVSLSRTKTDARRLEAPEYLDVESPSGHATILTGGLPYHRRIGERMLDSLLVVRGERARQFSLGIGVGIAQPAQAAVAFNTPPSGSLVTCPPPSAASGWFFHIDAKNVVATQWEPVWDERSDGVDASAQPAALRGVRVRLLETAGRAGRVTLRVFRAVTSARQVDFVGQTLLEATVEGDRVRLDFAANEWIEVEVTFAA